jgi:hypothetical protein
MHGHGEMSMKDPRRIVTAAALILAVATALVAAQTANPAQGRGTAAPTPAAVKRYPVNGNLAQLMRGIFFPNSNLIFTVQQRDPGVPPPPANIQPGTSSVFDWGMGIYTGWQVVENAAVALADVSPLMLAPELTCENGRPAPVTDPDWIRFTDQMISMSLRMYKLAQSKNQEAVAEATGDLSDACAACHQAYRDVIGRGRGANPPAGGANANRCLSRTAK